ncbi:MAG: hypothetical protein U0441_12520 [Polyangiaceae bacterium]
MRLPPIRKDSGAAQDGDDGDGEPSSSEDAQAPSSSSPISSADASSAEASSVETLPSVVSPSAIPPGSELETSIIPQATPHASPPPLDSYTAPAPSMPPSRRTTRPLLASEALMEDLAPVEPMGPQARVLCVVAGVLFAVLGVLPRFGVRIEGRAALIPSLVVGSVTVFAAVARVPYRKRAVAMLALGAIVAGLGAAGTGPAHGIATGGALWAIARTVAAAALPAALLFRARYRAFEGARLLLGLAFLAALPVAVHAVHILIDASTFGFTELGAVIGILLLTAGLPGFMGSETTAAGSFVAPVMIVAFGVQAGLARLGALVPGSIADVIGVVETAAEDGADLLPTAPTIPLSTTAVWDASLTAVALVASAFLSALGLFQILAWKFAPVARLIDVRRPKDSEPDDRPSIEDWTTRS